MPRSDRLLNLTHLLGGRRAVTVDELARQFEVSPRTIYRDLSDLARSRIPVARDEQGYRLLEGARLRPLNLTAHERALLRLALENPAIARQPALANALAVLRAKLDAATAAAEETPDGLALAGPDRSGSIPPGVVEALEPACRERHPVEIDYASLFGGQRAWRTVDPYALFHRSEAWYLAGRCHRHDEPRTFRLARIGAVRTLPDTFEPPAGFDLDAYLAHAWGVFRGERPFEVALRFDAALAPLLAHARHHEGEALTHLSSGELEYRVTVSHLDEIARWVLGFGGACRVLAPEGLRSRVCELAEGVVRRHRAIEGGWAT
jgi:predicted DNA-binding transcriptional regulator YafY